MEYSPKVIEIESAFDFLKIAYEKIRSNIDSGNRGFLQLHRGQSNSEWDITPSIEREPNKKLSFFEKNLLHEFKKSRPDEFSDLSLFNAMAKMQHHGMVTRLIDMTLNPAVALYFACCQLPDKDGEVYMFDSHRDEMLNLKQLDFIIDFYLRRDSWKKIDFFEKFAKNFNKEECENIFYFLLSNAPAVATTELRNERMRRQSSVFLISPFKSINKHLEAEKEKGKGLWEFVRDSEFRKYFSETNFVPIIEDAKSILITFHQDRKRYIIKSGSKKTILRELHSIGISESFLFPELEYEGKRIVEEYLYLTRQSD